MIVQLSRFSYSYMTWEKQKIYSQFEFPEFLDFTPISESSKSMQHRLTVLVIHMRCADFGHYISYVLNHETGKWSCFNDDKMKDATLDNVLKSGCGRESLSTNFLFYDRVGLNYDIGVAMPERIGIEVERENNQLRVNPLFYSKGYAEFMLHISSLKNRFSVFPLHYFFDTLPFTKHNGITIPSASR